MAKTQCKILLWFFGIALLVFQVYADKEPHEDSKEDNSVINQFFVLYKIKVLKETLLPIRKKN